MSTDTATATPLPEFPRYRSHKVVGGLKLRAVELDIAADHTRFIPADDRYPALVFADSEEVVKRCQAIEQGDPGYLVRYYPDGFLSWSPTRAFEDGNTRLPDPPDGDAIAEIPQLRIVHNSPRTSQAVKVTTRVRNDDGTFGETATEILRPGATTFVEVHAQHSVHLLPASNRD